MKRNELIDLILQEKPYYHFSWGEQFNMEHFIKGVADIQERHNLVVLTLKEVIKEQTIDEDSVEFVFSHFTKKIFGLPERILSIPKEQYKEMWEEFITLLETMEIRVISEDDMDYEIIEELLNQEEE